MDIEYLLWLQGIRETAAPVVQLFFSFLGSEIALAVALVIPCVMYWCIDKRSATFALFAYGASSLCNQLIKNIACVYRPWILDPRVKPDPTALAAAGGYSFPSGHTQSVASMTVGLAWKCGKRWLMVVAVLFSALVGFSRNFLGVHTPQDVLVGFLEGCVFVVIVHWLLPVLEKGEKYDLWTLAASVLLTVAYLAYVTRKPYPVDYVDGEILVDPFEMLVDCYKVAGVYLGIIVGWVVERRYVQFETGGLSVLESVMRLAFGGLFVLCAYEPLGHLFIGLLGANIGQFLRHFLAVFLAMAVAPAFFGRLGALLSGAVPKKGPRKARQS